jgi:hypothetical protein
LIDTAAGSGRSGDGEDRNMQFGYFTRSLNWWK